MKILLVGGPFDWKTLTMEHAPPSICLPIPSDAMAWTYDERADVDPPMPDFRVAEYRIDRPVSTDGYIYRHLETK